MKCKLTRCHICKDWYSPEVRNHCQTCGAARSPITYSFKRKDGSISTITVRSHLNYETGREIRSGFIPYYMTGGNALLIAQILMEGLPQR